MLTETILTFLLAFIRFMFITIFFFSFASKVKQPRELVHTIDRFNILAPKFTRPLAWCILLAEGAIPITLLSNHLLTGFTLSLILLIIFSLAVVIVLLKRTALPCNCFGVKNVPISIWTLIRNGGLIAGTLIGIGLVVALEPTVNSLALQETLIIAPISFFATLLGLNWQTVKDIVYSQ